MKKFIIKVPDSVTHISDWAGFENEMPTGQVIINKKLAGCGLTTWALTSDLPTVLCVPRVSLGENKHEQMDEKGLKHFYFEASKKKDPVLKRKDYEEKMRLLVNYLSLAPHGNYVPKVIVTYDSLPTIYGELRNSAIPFMYIVDEHQASFQDYTLKPDVIERVSELLRSISGRVWYVSATPILEKYLNSMEYLNTLPYVELEWPQNKIISRSVDVICEPMNSTVDKITEIINDFKRTGVFDTIVANGVSYDSKEAVFFVNDVEDIAKVIHKNGLSPNEVNILVANRNENRATIRRIAGGAFDLGKIPTFGKPHKTYTFCSKTMYYGVDFYSTSASTYIFADANIQSMQTDISLDFVQIIGRQRLDTNLFRSRCHVYVKTACQQGVTWQDLLTGQTGRWNDTVAICKAWNGLSQVALEAIKVDTRKCPYGVIYKNLNGIYIAKPCTNAKIVEQHAWELRNMVYSSQIRVQSMILASGMNLASPQLPLELNAMINDFFSRQDKLRCYAEFFDSRPGLFAQYAKNIGCIPSDFYNIYSLFGGAYIMQCNYDMDYLVSIYPMEYEKRMLAPEIYNTFLVGKAYAKTDIKEQLQNIYRKLGLQRHAKATDIAQFFELGDTRISNTNKNAFKIIRQL